MRIKLNELRSFVRKIIKEAFDTPTMSSDLDPGEKELAAKFPKWGEPSKMNMKQDSPVSVKSKQVAAILAKKGLTADAAMKKKTTQQLQQFISQMDPGDMFVADPDEIANDFAAQVLGVKKD